MKPLSIAAFVLLVPLTGYASDIRQRPFSYSQEAVTAKLDDQFVVCSDCPDNQLSLMPMVPKLAVRISTPITKELPAQIETQQHQNPKSESIETHTRVATVQFNFDNEHLSRDERLKFDGLLAVLSKQNTFDVTGYTCTIGTDGYNERLSIRRANHVAGIMKSNGFNVVTVEGKGKCCPASTDKRLNRRVEIVEHRKEEK